MKYKDQLIKNLKVKINKLNSELVELTDLLSLMEKQEVKEPQVQVETEVPKVYVTLFKESTDNIFDGVTLHINRNKDILDQVRDMKKQGFKVFVRNDAKTPEDKDILDRFATYLKLPMEG